MLKLLTVFMTTTLSYFAARYWSGHNLSVVPMGVTQIAVSMAITGITLFSLVIALDLSGICTQTKRSIDQCLGLIFGLVLSISLMVLIDTFCYAEYHVTFEMWALIYGISSTCTMIVSVSFNK